MKKKIELNAKVDYNIIWSSDYALTLCFTLLLSRLGHYLDQKRLKMGLYRHPWDDITYLMPDHLQHLRPASFE